MKKLRVRFVTEFVEGFSEEGLTMVSDYHEELEKNVGRAWH